MIETLFEAWASTPWIVRMVGEFLFVYIFIRGVIAKEITAWLEDRGFIKRSEQSAIYHFLDFFYYRFHPEKLDNIQTNPSKNAIVGVMKKHLDKWTVVARKVAIVQHGVHGHQCDNVLECNQGKCGALFTSRA